MFPTFRQLLFFACFATASALAQMPADGLPLDLDQLGEEIEKLSLYQEKSKAGFVTTTLAKIDAAARQPGSAGNMVVEAVRTVRFDGQTAAFGDWKKQNRDFLGSKVFETAAMANLNYLALTVRRSMVPTSAEMEKDVRGYLKFLNGNTTEVLLAELNRTDLDRGRMGEYRQMIEELLKQDVRSSFVTKALNLEGRFGKIDNWAGSAGDYSAIFDQNIRGALREAKDPRLLTTWDEEIQYRQEILSESKNKFDINQFTEVEKVRLMWSQARDMRVLGMDNRALKAEMQIASQNPGHPDFEDWIRTLKQDIDEMKEDQRGASFGVSGS